MLLQILFLTSLLFYNALGQALLGQDCGQFITKRQCETSPVCVWDKSAEQAGQTTCAAAGLTKANCNLCSCSSDIPLDIIFVIDASGSIGRTNFNLERQWIEYVVDGKISPNSRIGFIIFATEVNATRQCRFNGQSPPICFWPNRPPRLGAAGDPAARQSLIDYVKAIRYTRGYTNTQNAMSTAIEWRDEIFNIFRKFIIILLTDGQPFGRNGPEEVCQLELPIKNRGIQVVVVGIGNGWINQDGPDKVGCLVSDPDDMFYVPSFDAIADINPKFLAKLCPLVNNVIITEIKVRRSTFTDRILYPRFTNRDDPNEKWRGRFLEIYNRGGPLNVSQIQFEGFVSSVGLVFPIKIPINTYVVFYERPFRAADENDISCYKCTSCGTLVKNCNEPTAYSYIDGSGNSQNFNAYPNLPECRTVTGDTVHDPPTPTQADPTQLGGGRCYGTGTSDSPAIYIPCGICPDTTPYGCCIDATYTRTNWFQEVYDIQVAKVLIDNVTYDNAPNVWTLAPNGFTYELISKTYDNSIPSNWVSSCYEWGTPGADPINNCPPRCDTQSCRQKGDINATCISTGICDCNSGFYAKGIECSVIPKVPKCTATWLKQYDPATDTYVYLMSYSWDAVLLTEKTYKLSYTDKTSGTPVSKLTNATSTSITNVNFVSTSQPVGCVSVLVFDANGNPVEGQCTDCIVKTSPPSLSPTPAPTKSPTPSPSTAPTPSPVAPPRFCFWKDCEKVNLKNRDYCECNTYNSIGSISERTIRRRQCCKYPENWDWGKSILKNGLECGFQPKYWIPRIAPWILFIKCDPAFLPQLISRVRWSIRFDSAECIKNCPKEDKDKDKDKGKDKRRLFLSFEDRRRLQFNLSNGSSSNIDDAGFLLSPLGGEVIVPGNTSEGIAPVEVTVSALDESFLTDTEYMAVYLGTIENCTNIGDGNPACIPVYPNPIKLFVTRSAVCQGAKCAGTKEEKTNPWVWGLVGALVAFLCCLAALIYFFWWKTAVAKGEIAETKEDIAIENAQNEAGVGDDLKTGDVQFNPLMMGTGNGMVASDPMAAALEQQRNIQAVNFADTKIEKFAHREQFGQTANQSRFG